MIDIHTSNSPYYTNRRPEVLPFVPQQRARVLDTGCGQAVFLASVKNVEETWGIEPTNAAEAAATRLHEVIQADFDKAK